MRARRGETPRLYRGGSTPLGTVVSFPTEPQPDPGASRGHAHALFLVPLQPARTPARSSQGGSGASGIGSGTGDGGDLVRVRTREKLQLLGVVAAGVLTGITLGYVLVQLLINR